MNSVVFVPTLNAPCWIDFVFILFVGAVFFFHSSSLVLLSVAHNLLIAPPAQWPIDTVVVLGSF